MVVNARSATSPSTQLELPGFACLPNVAKHRLFFALLPDDNARMEISRCFLRLKRQYHLQCTSLKPAHFHVTLQLIGDFYEYPHAALQRARIAAESIVAPSFIVVFDRAASFQRLNAKKPLVLRMGTAGEEVLRTHRDQIMKVLRGNGLKINKSFTPHITMSYDKQLVPETSVAPITWRVREFVLIHSLLGHTQHTVLARWSLREI